MQSEGTTIPDIIIIKPQVFKDDRGNFFESYNSNSLSEFGIEASFVQDNQSLSEKNVLRGLHFQSPPYAQGKLVRVIKGAVLDVAVDIRKKSSSYGMWVSQVLSEDNKLMMWIPPGFAHGFLTLEPKTIFFYKCTEFYKKESEMTIKWDDSDLAVQWNIHNPIISEKDKKGLSFKEFESPFE